MQVFALWIVLFLVAAAAPGAEAARRLPAATDARTAEECGACHMAYPAQMLPARSWEKLMSNLSNHFGEDASLADEDRSAIAAYLTGRAADVDRAGTRYLRGLAASATPVRITDMPFWQRRHREISSRRFSDPKVKTAANCAACHTGERGFLGGLFSDDD